MSDEFFFDPQQYKGPDLIPDDWYSAEIIEATITIPSSGNGHMLNLTWKITDGDHEDRQVWQRLCFDHSKEQTRDIAQRFLKKLCRALDIHEQINTEIIKFKPVKVKVVTEVDKNGQYDDNNAIKGVRPLTDGDREALEAKTAPKSPTPKSSAAKPPPKPAGNGPGAAPWKKPAA